MIGLKEILIIQEKIIFRGFVMHNKAMEEILHQKTALDLSQCKRTVTGDYILDSSWGKFLEHIDYYDAKSERWICSIGKLTRPFPFVLTDGTKTILEPGTYLASLDSRWYTGVDNDCGFECVWLR